MTHPKSIPSIGHSDVSESAMRDLSLPGRSGSISIDGAEILVIERWMRLADRLGIPTLQAEAAARFLVQTYSEPQRRYHTLVHIAEGLALIESVRVWLREPDAFELGWLFHDSVYHPECAERGGNERASLELMSERCHAMGVGTAIIERASRLIELTIDHRASDEDTDEALFVDIDLSILGATPERYGEYTRELRSEYGMFSDLQFRAGRLRFLNSMLSHKTLFRTPLFRTVLESPARANLEWESSALSVEETSARTEGQPLKSADGF